MLTRRAATPTDDADALAWLKEAAIRRTGLAYYADKDDVLAKKLHGRLAKLNLNGYAEYQRLLSCDDGRREWNSLIDELVVNETYFFRYRSQFEALKSVALPDRAASGGDIRIWCAGCASGAEPYSLNILLKLELPHLFAGRTVEILGTDISRRNLRRARDGVFTPWELRQLPETYRTRCFERTGNEWRLREPFKQGVTFAQHNLATDAEAFASSHRSAFDVVFCRNVMIYFDADLTRRLLHWFRECLHDGGWLIVGHAEPYLEIANLFEPVPVNDTTLYRKAASKAWRPAGSPALPLAAPAPAPAAVASPPAAKPRARPSERPAARGGNDGEVSIAAARRLANLGQWTQANHVCQQLLKASPLDAEAHYLMALVDEHRGHHPEAIEAFKRALYSDRDFALAHYHLGMAWARTGRPVEAVRALRSAVALVSSATETDGVRAGEGLTAGELLALTKQVLKTIEGVTTGWP